MCRKSAGRQRGEGTVCQSDLVLGDKLREGGWLRLPFGSEDEGLAAGGAGALLRRRTRSGCWSVPQRPALIFISYGRQNLDLQGEPAG